MLTDDQLKKYAEVLFWGLKTARKNPYRKKDLILIQYDPPALKLAEICYAKVLERGLHPIQRMGLTCGMEKSFFTLADKGQLVFIPPGDEKLYGQIQGRIYLRAPESLTHLKDVDSARIGRVLVSRKPLRDLLDRREEQGSYSWTLCSFPTRELARQAKTTLPKYTAQIIKACFLDQKNPVKAWESVHAQVSRIKKWLNNLKMDILYIESRNINLKLKVGENRAWRGVSGHNIPSFEIFFSPDWRGTEGQYYANLPSFRSGNYVEGVRLSLEKGTVRQVQAKKGREFILKQIAMDKGASRVGEFSLTDKRFSRIDRFMADTLFDENYGGPYGNCHLALGASYTDTYSGNLADLTAARKKDLGFNDSALHWDLVNTEDKMVTAHLKTGKKIILYEKGQFNY